MKKSYIIKENIKKVTCEQIKSNIIFTLDNKEIIRNMNNCIDIIFLRDINQKYKLGIDFSYII